MEQDSSVALRLGINLSKSESGNAWALLFTEKSRICLTYHLQIFKFPRQDALRTNMFKNISIL
jgi:hypothetical protein